MIHLLLSVLTTMVFAAKTPIKPHVAKGKEISQTFTKWIEPGTYTGNIPRRDTECSVEITTTKGYLSVSVDDLSSDISFSSSASVSEYKNGAKFTTESEDGDETHGGYIFTYDTKVYRQKGGPKVYIIETKEYVDEDRDKEVTVRSCENLVKS